MSKMIEADNLIATRRPDLVIVNKKKVTCRIVDFVVPAEQKMQIKENEKSDTY